MDTNTEIKLIYFAQETENLGQSIVRSLGLNLEGAVNREHDL